MVTVNDYLASRDSEWMAYLYNWLGLSTGSITKSTPLHTRRQEYEKDITYVENTELGFDYLRDNLVKSNAERQLLWRPLHYAIVDEVDSVLIDDARTPLIISGPVPQGDRHDRDLRHRLQEGQHAAPRRRAGHAQGDGEGRHDGEDRREVRHREERPDPEVVGTLRQARV